MRNSTRIERATVADRQRAVALEAQVYADEHAHVPPVEHGATYFVAKTVGDDLIASFRILGPEHRPFDFEQQSALPFLETGRRVALIGRLCVRPDFRTTGRQAALPVEMLRVARAHCEHEGYTDLVMYTFPKLCRFYERALFRRCHASFHHDGYHTEMEILRLDLMHLRALLASGDRRAALLYGQPPSGAT